MIEDHFRKIIMIMGLDLSDDSLQNTPRRVARMFEEEIFSGLDPGNKPEITLLVQYYARHPQVQERLMVQIAEALKEAMGTEDVAVYLDTTHMCVTMRGIQDPDSSTVTSSFHGAFREEARRKEFLEMIR